jgi:hypothetical protein
MRTLLRCYHRVKLFRQRHAIFVVVSAYALTSHDVVNGTHTGNSMSSGDHDYVGVAERTRRYTAQEFNAKNTVVHATTANHHVETLLPRRRSRTVVRNAIRQPRLSSLTAAIIRRLLVVNGL